MHKLIGVPRTFGRDCTYIQIYIHLPPKSMETIGLNVHIARPLSEAVQFLKEILARISKLT